MNAGERIVAESNRIASAQDNRTSEGNKMNTLFLLRIAWQVRRIPGVLFAVFRILAWPPSRIRFDRIIKGK